MNHTADISLGADWLDSSSEVKDLGVLQDKQLSVSQKRTLVANANSLLGCSRKSIAGRWREVTLPLCCGFTHQAAKTTEPFTLSPHPQWDGGEYQIKR